MDIELLDREPAAAPQRALATTATPADLLRIAVENGADLDRLERLMALQERWEATEARKAYDAAFAAFKAEAVTIVKSRTVDAGPLNGKKYAELYAVVNAVTPALSRHGLSSSWKITRDEPQWIEVTCTLKHTGGHTESVSMGGPPDVGGAKNPIQARASTVSYLERYTLKAITGLSEQEDDNDGGRQAAGWVEQAAKAETLQALEAIKREGAQAFTKARDVPGYTEFMRAVGKRHAELKKAV
jgi:hypothetical protein